MSSATDNGTALVPTVPPEALGGTLGITPTGNLVNTLGVRWCSLPLDSQEAEDLMLASVGETSLDTDDILSKELGVVAWLVRHQEWTDKETGEVRAGPTVYLLTDTGDTYRSSSRGVIEGLSIVCARRAPGLYAPPVGIVIKRLKTAGGKPRHIVVRAPNKIDPVVVKGANRGK